MAMYGNVWQCIVMCGNLPAVTVLGHATCQILLCSATLLLARLLLAPWRSPRDICLPSLLYIPLLLLLSLISSLDSNPQALVQRHLCEPSHYTKLSLHCLGRPQ